MKYKKRELCKHGIFLGNFDYLLLLRKKGLMCISLLSCMILIYLKLFCVDKQKNKIKQKTNKQTKKKEDK